MERIRIAQIVGDARLGGVSRCVLQYFESVDRDRFAFDFITYGPAETDAKIRALGGNVLFIPPLTNVVSSHAALERLLREGEYDIVHSHMTTLSAIALHAAEKAGAKVRICHAHSTIMPECEHKAVKKILRPLCVRNATHLAACSVFAAENIFRDRAKDAFILKNAVDTERFANAGEKEASKKALGLSGMVFLFLGRFAAQKNLCFLIRAFGEFLKRGGDGTLVLTGCGREEENMRKLIRDRSLENRVRIFPPADNTQDYYAAADAFCLPSLYEGLPIVAVEAQAAGVPGVYSAEITREADLLPGNVFLPVGKGDESQWADCFLKLYRERESAGKCGASLPSAARMAALGDAGYEIRTAAGALERYYEGLLR